MAGPAEFEENQQIGPVLDENPEGLVRPESGNGAHFAEMAKSMIAAVIEVIMSKCADADRNLITVMDMLFSADFEKTLTE